MYSIHSMLIEPCFHSVVVTAEKILIVFLFSNINQNVQKAKMKDALHICYDLAKLIQDVDVCSYWRIYQYKAILSMVN